MNNLKHLAEVIVTEAELTEQLVEVMKQQQQALVNLDAATVENTVDRQEELLLSIEGLENERVRLTNEIWQTVAPSQPIGTSVSLTTLLEYLDDEEAEELSTVGARLQNAVVRMTNLNQANKYLIEHSRRFVRETFKIVTNGYSRQLVDHKI